MTNIINKFEKIKQFKLYKKFAEIFSLDPRSLALFRILLGLLIILDLITRSRYLEAHYTDRGLMPRWTLLEYFSHEALFSIHLISGNFWIIAFLFILNAAFAFMLIIGWRTKLAACLCWFFLMSIQNRNNQILQGGDVLFRMILLFSIFLPIDRFWSIDSRNKIKDPSPVFTTASFAYILQILILYICAAQFKLSDPWMKYLDGVYLALNADHFATVYAQKFLQYPNLNKFLSLFTLYLEAGMPFALICPFFFQYTRFWAVIMLICMHIGFATGLSVGFFWIIDIISLLALLPTVVWDLLERTSIYIIVGYFRETFFDNLINNILKIQLIIKNNISKSKILFSNIFLIITTGYIVLWVAPELPIENSLKVSENWGWYGKLFGLDQSWQMFSPIPMTDDGWWVIVGKQKDGTEVDVLERKAGSVSFEKPKLLYKTYVTDRWRKYYRNLLIYKDDHAILAYSRGLCGNWNRLETDENKKLDSFEIYYMLELTKPNYEKPSIEKKLKWQHFCFKVPDNFEKKVN